MVLISIPGAFVCPVCVYKISNLILNVFVRVYGGMGSGVKRTEMKRKEKPDMKNRVRKGSERIRTKIK